jgi:hypothetical protein
MWRFKKILTLGVPLLVTWIVACGDRDLSDVDPAPVSVHGSVSDESTQEPLSFVEVIVSGFTPWTTQDNGYYRVVVGAGSVNADSLFFRKEVYVVKPLGHEASEIQETLSRVNEGRIISSFRIDSPML